jgi:hypothetical protein
MGSTLPFPARKRVLVPAFWDAFACRQAVATHIGENRRVSEPCRLPFADALGQPRSVRVYEHWVPVNPEWWNNELIDRGPPGGPLQVTYDSRHRPGIRRGALFELAATTDSSDGELRLLWHTLAWGGGKRARLMSKRLDSVAANPEGAASALRTAVANAQASPVDAYETLYPSGRTLLKYLGPAFFTKFLYFAGRGVATHPCAILDRVVAAKPSRAGVGWVAVGRLVGCDLRAVLRTPGLLGA